MTEDAMLRGDRFDVREVTARFKAIGAKLECTICSSKDPPIVDVADSMLKMKDLERFITLTCQECGQVRMFDNQRLKVRPQRWGCRGDYSTTVHGGRYIGVCNGLHVAWARRKGCSAHSQAGQRHYRIRL